jgi:hypothetical protein
MTHRDIRFLSSRVLHGPNRWTWTPVLEVIVDIGDLEDCPSHLLPGYPERLVSMLPSLWTHRCSIGEPGGFIRRLHEGTWPCHILEHITLELQNLAGLPGGFGRARETDTRGVYVVVVSCRAEAVTRQALAAARELVLAAMADTPFDVDAAVEHLTRLVEQHWLPGWMTDVLLAAESREIPWTRGEGSLCTLTLGRGRRRRILWSGGSDRTGAIASGIAEDPELCARLLSDAGIHTGTPSDDTAQDNTHTTRYLVMGEDVLTGDGMQTVDADTAFVLRLAARVVGLDLVTIETGAAGPSGAPAITRMLPGIHPLPGTPRPIERYTRLGETLVNHLFASPDDARRCVVGITSSDPAASLVEGVQRQLAAKGHTLGQPASRQVDAAVIHRHPRDILHAGMGDERCHIGILTDMPDPASLGDPLITTDAALASVLRCQVDVVLASGTAILTADDERVVHLAQHSRGNVLFFSVSGLSDTAQIKRLLETGSRLSRLLQVHDGHVVCEGLEAREIIIALDRLPDGWATRHARHPLLVLMAAGLALGLSPDTLVETLSGMPTPSSQPPPEVLP